MVKELTLIFVILGQQKISGRALLNPDISLIGDIINRNVIADEVKNSFGIREFEFGVQGYLHPHIKVDSFVAIHIEPFEFPGHEHEGGAGEHFHRKATMEIEEGYLSFINVLPGISGRLGRKYVSFGKFNPLHPEQWLYVDAPAVIREVLGDHNFTGDGGSMIISPNLGFLLSFEFGAWRNFAGPYKDLFLSQRLFSSLGIGNLEVGIGISSTQGSLPDSPQKISSISGGDLTLGYITERGKLEFIAEPIFVISDKMEYRGIYVSGVYTSPLRFFQAGVRLDLVGETLGVSPIFSYLITETTKVRLQYSLYAQHSHLMHIVFVQFLFGLGPHAHVLQF